MLMVVMLIHLMDIADHFIYRDSLNGYYTPDTWIDFGPRGDTSGLYWSTGGGAGWHIYPENTTYLRIRSGYSAAVGLTLNTNGTTRGYVYANSSDTVGFLDKGGSWRFGALDPQGNLSKRYRILSGILKRYLVLD